MLSDIGSTVLNHRFGVYSSLNVENFTFKLKVLKKKTFCFGDETTTPV